MFTMRDKDGNSLLHYSVRFGTIECTKLLLSFGAPPRTANHNMEIPLVIAIGEKKYEHQIALLEYKTSDQILSNNKIGKNPIHLALDEYDDNPKCFDILFPKYNDYELTNAPTVHGAPLVYAVREVQSAKPLAAILDRKDIKILCASKKGITGIHWACKLNKIEHVRLFINKKCSVNVTTHTGMTPLHYACKQVSIDITKLLFTLQEKPIVTSRNIHGDTPLHCLLNAIKTIKGDSSDTVNIDDVSNIIKIMVGHNKPESFFFEENDNGVSPYSMNPELLSKFTKQTESTPETLSGDKFRLQVCSDLHIEFGHDVKTLLTPKAKYLALIGDIGVLHKEDAYKSFLLQCADQFEKVFVVSGNHEYYRSEYHACNKKIKDICDQHESLFYLLKGSHYLEKENVRVIGTTLWSKVPEENTKAVQTFLNDYRRISIKDPDDPEAKERMILCKDTNAWFDSELEFVKTQIKEASTLKQRVVILTHHSPVLGFGCSNPEYWGQNTNCAFATDLRHMFEEPVKSWCYGHTHWFHDMTFNGVRVISNPRGYYENKAYIPSKILIVSDGKSQE